MQLMRKRSRRVYFLRVSLDQFQWLLNNVGCGSPGYRALTHVTVLNKTVAFFCSDAQYRSLLKAAKEFGGEIATKLETERNLSVAERRVPARRPRR
jgi:hypothetical protein